MQGNKQARGFFRREKGLIFSPSIVLIAFAALLWGFIIIQAKNAPEKHEIGERQVQVFKAIQRGERALLYTDLSAMLAVDQAFYDLGVNGGFGEISNCGQYLGTNLWNSKTGYCMPDSTAEFPLMFNKDFQKILATYDDVMISVDNYDYNFDASKNVLAGIATTDVVLPIGTPQFQAGTLGGEQIYTAYSAVYQPPKNAQETLERINSDYSGTISQALAEDGISGLIDTSLMAAMIAQESRGVYDAISPTGCLGVAQACYCTAWAYSSLPKGGGCQGYSKTGIELYQKLKTCNCVGTGNSKVCECNPGNDDRFQVDPSIKLMSHRLSSALDHYDGYKEQLILGITAYNTGEGVLDKAIQKASAGGANKKDLTWAEIASKIDAGLVAELIPYFRTRPAEAQRQVRDLLAYAQSVLGYRQKYLELYPSSPGSASPDPERPVVIEQKKYSSSTIVGASGKYAIKPSFSVEIPFSFQDYKNIMEESLKMIAACNNTGQVEKCVADFVAGLNSKWGENLVWDIGECGQYPDTLVSQIAEGMEDCRSSIEDNCTCLVQLPHKDDPIIAESYISMKNRLGNLDMYYGRLEDEDASQETGTRRKAGYNMKNANVSLLALSDEQEPMQNAEDLEIQIIFSSDRFDRVVFSGSETGYGTEWIYDENSKLSEENDVILLYKMGNNLSFVKPGDAARPDLARKCGPDRTTKICVRTKTELVAYDADDEEVKNRNAKVGYAVYIPDNIPPAKVRNILAEDAPGAENALRITWDKGSEEDIMRYRIYYSTEPFSEISNFNPVLFLADEVEKNLDDAQTTQSSIIRGLSLYDNLAERNRYYIAVTAVDYVGNEEKMIGAAPGPDGSGGNAEIDDIDDARPVIIPGFFAQASGGSVTLLWNKPDTNNDGSRVWDLQGYRLYNGDDSFVANIVNAEATTYTVEGVSSGTHSWKLEAVDETWKSATPALKIESNSVEIP
ncbi:MAG: hypothetical protein QS98_C0006G0022 [archaeon GW2011_AR3]|nr:MAG: hypothetical protein QS98_C0006G0022 [archaeon GW2011_AR3]MBS3109217.1 hypothetical protein [Candidatus Woesearchaeota archaeon]